MFKKKGRDKPALQIAKMKWFGYYIVIETGMEDGFWVFGWKREAL